MDITSLNNILILGKPPVFWGGLLVLLLFSLTALIATLSMKGKIRSNVKRHQISALVSIIFALVHGTLGLLTSNKPLSMLLGALTVIMFIVSAIFAYATVNKGSIKVSVREHQIMIYISIGIAILHAVYSIFMS